MRRRILFGALLLVAIAAGGARAEDRKAERAREMGSQPIEITADRVSADSVNNTVTFEGNVIARQGDVTMYADRLRAEYSRQAGAVERIEAEGNVRFLQEGREARAARATYYNLEQRVVLSGGASLKEGRNTLQGETLTIYLRENRTVVSGGEGGGRVRAVINPKGVMETPKK